MKAKEFLKQYEYAKKVAERCREVYETEMLQIDAIGSTLSGDGQPRGSGVSRKTENKAIRLADKAMKWKEAELEAIEMKEKVFSMIWDVPGVEGDVLYERYVNLKNWTEIADKLHYTERGIYIVHGRALQIVEGRLNSVHVISKNMHL